APPGCGPWPFRFSNVSRRRSGSPRSPAQPEHGERREPVPGARMHYAPPMRASVNIATRGSQLALWQARRVEALLRRAEPELAVELVVIKTKGDKILDVPLAKVGGKGLFVKEIEEALLDGRADLAVHSMKDVPAELAPGLVM